MASSSYENNLYCDFSGAAAKAVAGKRWVACIFDATGTNLQSISGQQSLKINRSADPIEVGSKDGGGWKSTIPGTKEWSVEIDGNYVKSDTCHTLLATAFNNDTPLCLKIVDQGDNYAPLFGGLCYLTDYPIDANWDDAVGFSLTLKGLGALTDLTGNTTATQKPVGATVSE